MKIKFRKSPTGLGYAYFEGDTATLPDVAAEELIDLGFANKVDDEHKLPEDCPNRDLLEKAGFGTLNSLRDITLEDLTALEGIGKKSAEKILEYVKEAK